MAVFIDGCFWHGCPVHHTIAKTNGAFWADKVARNRARDQEADQLLADEGWIPLRFWEQQATEEIVDCIVELVRRFGPTREDPT